MSDESQNSFLQGNPVIDSVLDVVVPQTDPQVLNVGFSHTRIGTSKRDDETYCATQ